MKNQIITKLPRKNLNIDWKSCIDMNIDVMYDNKHYTFLIKDYFLDDKGYKLLINYTNEEGKSYINAMSITTVKMCNFGEIVGKKTSRYKYNVDDIINTKTSNLKILQLCRLEKKKRKAYKYQCLSCGNIDTITECNLNDGKGCNVCCTSSQKVLIGYNDIPTTAPWMVKFFQGGYDEAKMYTKSSNKKIKPICPDCGKVKDKEISVYKIYSRKSIGCTCGDGLSYGHKYIYSLLTQLNVDFKDNKTFDWCKFYNPYKEKETNGEYDFIIEDLKLIIEVDGGFHREDNNMNDMTKEESKYLDDVKERLSSENGYSVVRVYYDDIGVEVKPYIVKSKLNTLFDLSNINWNKCEAFALSNLCKKACEIKRGNPNMTTTEIGEIMNLDKVTILKYLKKGNKLNWCFYDPKEEMRRGGKSTGKPIKCIDNDIVFSSMIECVLKSKEIFGVEFNQKGLSGAIKNDAIYKGYKFILI